MKKWGLFLAILMLALSVRVLADEPEWVYSNNQGGVGVYNGAGGEVIVPDTLEGQTVYTVGDGVFRNLGSLTALTLPATVRSIGSSCLNNCANLETVTLPEGLQSIEYNNFMSLPKLTELTVPASVAVIDYSINWCENLKKITFLGACPEFTRPDFCLSVLSPDVTVYVPDDELAAYRAAITTLEDEQIQPSGQKAVRYDWTAKAEDLTFDAETGAITAYTGHDLRVDLPAQIDGVPVTSIDMYAFDGSRVVSLTVPEGVTVIESMAFDGAADLSVITLPDSLREIGSHAFDGCDCYVIRWGNGIEKIGDGAFRYTNPDGELNLPDSLREIGEEAFLGASLRNAHFGGQIRKVGARAFNRTNLNYIEWDAYDLPEFGEEAFADTRLEDIDLPWDSSWENMKAWQAAIDAQTEGCRVWINNPPDCELPASDTCTYESYPDGTLYLSAYTGDQEALVLWHTMDDVQVTGIGDGVFKGNQTLKKYRVTHNDTFTAIGAEAFAGSAVETVDLYYTVETIGAGAFRDCQGLTEITLPASLTSVGAGAFAGCANLKTVHILCDPAILPADAFDGTAYAAVPLIEMPFAPHPESDFEINAETGMLTAYTGDAIDVVIPREIGGVTVRGIGYGAFERARDYTDSGMMTNQTSWLHLRSVVIPETVETIEDSAFSYCQQLELVLCYGKLKSTGRATFQLCRALKDVIFVNGVSDIDNYAFEHCEALERVYWGDHLRRIGQNAFNHCGLTRVVIDAEIVDEGAFNHSALREVTLTERVREIHSAAFWGCEDLTYFACQFSEADRFVDGGPTGGIPQSGVTTLFPAATTDDQLKALKNKLNVWNGGHLNNDNAITLQDVDAQPVALPDVEALRQAVASAPTDQPAPTAEPAPAAPPADLLPIDDVNAVLGDWSLYVMIEDGQTIYPADFGIEGSLTLNADGTGKVAVGETSAMKWRFADGFVYMSLDELDAPETPIGLNGDGCLVASEDGMSMIFARAGQKPERPEGEGLPAPIADMDALLGDWQVIEMSLEGETFDPAAFGMVMPLTLNADGTGTLTTEDETAIAWYQKEGVLFFRVDEDVSIPVALDENGHLVLSVMGTGMTFARPEGAAQPALAETPAPAGGIDLTPYHGTWYGVMIDAGIEPMDARDIGMTLTVGEDNVAYSSFDNVTAPVLVKEGHVVCDDREMKIVEKGRLMWGNDYGSCIYFSKDPSDVMQPSECPTRVPLPTETPTLLTAAPDAPAQNGASGFETEKKYVAVSYSYGGVTVDAATLGAEYSLTLHADGSCDFIVGGVPMNGTTWSTVDANTIMLDYMGVKYTPTLQNGKPTLDYYGMLLNYEIQ